MSTVAFQTGQQEQAYLESAAASAGLDARALEAVFAHEGITYPAEVGDGGTSFGPGQMHAGGALPSSVWAKGPAYAQQWANSPAGIDYLIAGIRRAVGTSTQGPAEIYAQVTNFEKPKDIPGEISASLQTYQAGGAPSIADRTATAAAGIGVTGTQQTVGTMPIPNYTPGSSTAQPASFNWNPFDLFGIPGEVEDLFIRGFEMLFGVALLGIAVYGVYQALTKTSAAGVVSTLAAPVTGPAKAVPAARAAKAKTAAKAATGARRQARAEELHTARVKTEKARATELRTRTRHRRRPRSEQEAAEKRAYIRGATDQLHQRTG